MNLECVEGEYLVSWIGHPRRGPEAKNWCNEQFGAGWGHSGSSGPVYANTGLSLHVFYFKRLYHAQWFMMKWNDD